MKTLLLLCIFKAPALIFANTQTVNEMFKDWPLKTESVINEKIDEETSIDIIGTGHADGSINIWQVMQAGVLCLLTKIESSDIFNQSSSNEEVRVLSYSTISQSLMPTLN